MSPRDELLAAGLMIGLALASGDRTLIRFCEIAFLPTLPRKETPPKVIEWIR